MTGDDFVRPVGETRASLSQILAEFRGHPDTAEPVFIGSHRKPEAVLVPFGQFRRGDVLLPARSTPLMELVRSKKALVTRLAGLSMIGAVAVFGSVALGEEDADSDIDFLIDPLPKASYFDFAQFAIDMEALFDRPADVTVRRALDPVRDARILADALPL